MPPTCISTPEARVRYDEISSAQCGANFVMQAFPCKTVHFKYVQSNFRGGSNRPVTNLIATKERVGHAHQHGIRRKEAEPITNSIEAEREPSVRAVLGDWLFGYIHPYPDGNGRMARFLMNVLMASGGISP
jgi:hypothetical protein